MQNFYVLHNNNYLVSDLDFKHGIYYSSSMSDSEYRGIPLQESTHKDQSARKRGSTLLRTAAGLILLGTTAGDTAVSPSILPPHEFKYSLVAQADINAKDIEVSPMDAAQNARTILNRIINPIYLSTGPIHSIIDNLTDPIEATANGSLSVVQTELPDRSPFGFLIPGSKDTSWKIGFHQDGSQDPTFGIKLNKDETTGAQGISFTTAIKKDGSLLEWLGTEGNPDMPFTPNSEDRTKWLNSAKKLFKVPTSWDAKWQEINTDSSNGDKRNMGYEYSATDDNRCINTYGIYISKFEKSNVSEATEDSEAVVTFTIDTEDKK